MESEKYIKKWLEGSLTEEEKKEFEASPAYTSLEKLSKSVTAFKAPNYDIESELNNLKEQKAGRGKIVQMRWLAPLIRIAAILFIIIGSYIFFYLNITTSYETVAGQKTHIFLPDSSEVLINALSHISYKERLWNYNREVNLDGEAFFDVAKGSRFDVETSFGIVSVLGTQFNVKNRDNYFEVVCYEGSVNVERSGKNSQLSAGNALRIIKGVLDISSNLTDDSPSWLNNESSFRSIPFDQVIREFERQYDVSIKTSGVDLNQLFTGKFVHNDQILALQSISLPLNLKFEIEHGNQIILSGRGD